MLFRLLSFVLLILTGLAATPATAQHRDQPNLASREHPLPVATDFNLITAIDVSDSINRHDEWLQYSGLARGVVDAEFLNRIAQGAEGRIGFVAFTWSSGGQVAVVVPWTVIETRADAERVAAQFNAAPRIDRSAFGRYRPLSSSVDRDRGGMTDIAEAIEAAVRLSLAAPFPAPRSVVNILSNGVDNNGQDPSAIRDNAIRMGMTINGIVFGDRDDLPDYFRQNVIGGPGAFLMTVQKPDDLPGALEKKFWQDLLAGIALLPAG
jgi:hypothetical protein